MNKKTLLVLSAFFSFLIATTAYLHSASQASVGALGNRGPAVLCADDWPPPFPPPKQG
jgi:hypothetical protein